MIVHIIPLNYAVYVTNAAYITITEKRKLQTLKCLLVFKVTIIVRILMKKHVFIKL